MIWFRTPQHARTGRQLISPVPLAVRGRMSAHAAHAGIHAQVSRSSQPGLAVAHPSNAPAVSAPRSRGGRGR